MGRFTAVSRAAPCLVTALFVGACPGPDPDPEPEPWASVVEAEDAGVMLAAWSDGEALLMVGGRLSGSPMDEPGGPGHLVRVSESGACVERNIAERTLWWIDGPAEGEWYAVGERGTIVHEVDGVRTDESVETDATLYGVWSSGDAPIAVGGDPFQNTGEVWRKEGDDWVVVAADLDGVAFKVWEDWIVGDGVAWQLEGDVLTPHHPPEDAKLLTVRGRAADDVWAVGGFSAPVLLHWDGVQWTEESVPPTCATAGLNGLWTGPGEDVYVAGFFGGVGVLGDEGWSCPDAPLTFDHFHAVWPHDGRAWWVGGNLLDASGERTTLAVEGQDELDAIVDCE